MAVDLPTLAQHVVGKTEDKLSDGERAIMTDLLGWSTALVDRYIGDSPIPEEIRHSAVLRVAYFDHHSRTSRRPADGGQLQQPFRRDLPLNPLRASGAMSLLSPWKRRGVGVSA